ncbi:MAG: response regulator [Magnetococcales bacterium]|nr:response regulator [Magnetococcales bacterium]NGZ26971.1 response regulator [Magnetococcales bacterium]
MMEKTVVVVDDSSLMRSIIKNIVNSDPLLTTVGEAANGREALEVAAITNPDVILLDIEMPELDGLDCLKYLRLLHRAQVVIVSSMGQAGSSQSLEAIRLGAAAVVAKPSGTLSLDMAQKAGDTLLHAVRQAVGLPTASVA